MARKPPDCVSVSRTLNWPSRHLGSSESRVGRKSFGRAAKCCCLVNFYRRKSLLMIARASERCNLITSRPILLVACLRYYIRKATKISSSSSFQPKNSLKFASRTTFVFPLFLLSRDFLSFFNVFSTIAYFLSPNIFSSNVT